MANGEWDWLDGETGQWSRDGTKQQEKLQRYAASLTEAEPCTDPSFPNGRITKPQLPGSSQG